MTGTRHSAQILVVEDDPIIASLIGNRLEKLGYSLAGRVHSAKEALAALAVQKPDLILMDIILGEEIDGIDLALMIRKESDIPIVFITSSTDDATIERVKRTNPDGYVVKPFTDDSLRISVELALARPRAGP